MSDAKRREKWCTRGEVIRRELQQNRLLIAHKMGNSEDVFPRSIAMQLVTRQKISELVPLYHLSLLGIRILRILFKLYHNKTRKINALEDKISAR